jgi:hypothetical protein
MDKDNAHSADDANTVLVFGLPFGKDHYNRRLGLVQSYHAKSKMHTVAFADGDTVKVKKHNLFYATREHFLTTGAQLTRLEDVTSVQPGPYGRGVFATADIPAGTLLTTTTLNVCMAPEDIVALDAKFAQWIHTSLFKLMEKEPKSSTIMFDMNHAPALRFVGKLAQLQHHLIIAGLMQYDCFSPACLTLNMRRSCGPEFCWLQFWIEELAKVGFAPPLVYHLWHLVRNYSWPSATGDMISFGYRLCIANCEPRRWAEYEKVMEGLQDVCLDIYADRKLSMAMMSPPQKDSNMHLFLTHALKIGDELFFDYDLAYVSNKADTLRGIFFMEKEQGVHWSNVYLNVAKNVSDAVFEHLIIFFNAQLDEFKHNKAAAKNARAARAALPPALRTPPVPPALRTPTVPPPSASTAIQTYTCAQTEMRLCDNACCRQRMPHPRFCARCKITAYCSRDCQTAAWRTHKPECAPPEKGAK